MQKKTLHTINTYNHRNKKQF